MAKKIEVKPEEALVSQNSSLPEHLRKYASLGAVGLENIQQDEMVMPRLAIAQSTSPQLNKTKPEFIRGLETGNMFNSLTGEIYGDGPLKITPLLKFSSRALFPPRGEGDLPICSTKTLSEEGRLIDGPITPQGCDICPHSQFLTTPRSDGTVSPDCTLYFNYIVLIHKPDGSLEPIAFSAKSKMLKPAKKWNAIMRMRNLPAFIQCFNFSTVPETAPRGSFFNVRIDRDLDISADKIETAEKLFTQFSNVDLKIDIRGDRPVENESEHGM